MTLKRKPPPGNVRRINSTGQNLRYTLTNKTGRIVQCESHLERKLALLFERDVTVIDYASQPEKFLWIDETGKHHTYVPDFMVWRLDGNIEIHEVTVTVRRERLSGRENAAQQICMTRGWHYLVHTEETLPDDVILLNLIGLYPFRATAYHQPTLRALVLERLMQGSQTTAQLIQYLLTKADEPRDQIYPALYHYIWHQHISVDLNNLLFEEGHLRSAAQLSYGNILNE